MTRIQSQATFALSTVAALLLLLPAHAFSAEGVFDKTLSVHGPVTLNISTGSGYIHLSPGSDNQVHIVGHVKASHGSLSMSSPEERVKEVVDNPPIEQVGNIIRVGKNDHGIKNVSIDYEVTAPRDTELTANSGSGDLRVESIGRNVKLSTGSGSISARELRGNLSLSTGSGDIQAQQIEPGDVKAETGSGSLHLSGIQGALKAQTGSGDIEIEGKPTADWKIGTGSGSVNLTTASASYTLDASTGSGSVKSDVPLTVEGSLERHHVTGKVNGGGPLVRIETGSGSIHIH
jgi:putative adhesin